MTAPTVSAPIWMWVAYALIVGLMMLLASGGGIAGVMGVFFAAAFSFQFWTYATARGIALDRAAS